MLTALLDDDVEASEVAADAEVPVEPLAVRLWIRLDRSLDSFPPAPPAPPNPGGGPSQAPAWVADASAVVPVDEVPDPDGEFDPVSCDFKASKRL